MPIRLYKLGQGIRMHFLLFLLAGGRAQKLDFSWKEGWDLKVMHASTGQKPSDMVPIMGIKKIVLLLISHIRGELLRIIFIETVKELSFERIGVCPSDLAWGFLLPFWQPNR
eukprot:5129862-Ditylum_brightwellii.AAC.1